VLQCVAVRSSVLQCIPVHSSVLQCVAVCCSALQCVAVRTSVLQCDENEECSRCALAAIRVVQGDTLTYLLHFDVLQCVAVCCSLLQ